MTVCETSIPGLDAALAKPQATKEFDGVICFGGEDWWYHNRGHYDMQMMREISSSLSPPSSSSSMRGGGAPVLYVNSIGMRVPRIGEGRMFVTRVRRKLKSVRRGLEEARPGFWVFSPLAAPGRVGRALTRRLAPWQVERAARRVGIARPLVWVACPPAIDAVERLRGVAGLVYQRTDRFEEFAGVDAAQIRDCDARLKRRADMTVFCATHLYEREAEQCRAAAYIDHGVDYERFAAAGAAIDDGGEEAMATPADVREIARPRVGFIGGIDSHTFDPALFVDVARRLPHCQFLLVGACSLPDGWTGDLPNVHLLGQRPYEDVAAYMASCDVLIMPWNENEWIRACNPVKLKEYLAVGRPIVTRPFDELRRYEGFVRIASTPEKFAGEIEASLREPVDKDRLRSRVRGETWRRKGEAVLERLREAGLCANGHGAAAADVAQPLNATQASMIRSNS